MKSVTSGKFATCGKAWAGIPNAKYEGILTISRANTNRSAAILHAVLDQRLEQFGQCRHSVYLTVSRATSSIVVTPSITL